MKVKCLAQEHNEMTPRQGSYPDRSIRVLPNHWDTRHPLDKNKTAYIIMKTHRVNCLPETVICSVHVEVRPAPSVAVYFTSCGTELTTNSLLSAPTSLVIDGGCPLLSVAVALGMHTFAVGFPGSVGTEMELGQVIVGGRTSKKL